MTYKAIYLSFCLLVLFFAIRYIGNQLAQWTKSDHERALEQARILGERMRRSKQLTEIRQALGRIKNRKAV